MSLHKEKDLKQKDDRLFSSYSLCSKCIHLGKTIYRRKCIHYIGDKKNENRKRNKKANGTVY